MENVTLLGFSHANISGKHIFVLVVNVQCNGNRMSYRPLPNRFGKYDDQPGVRPSLNIAV